MVMPQVQGHVTDGMSLNPSMQLTPATFQSGKLYLLNDITDGKGHFVCCPCKTREPQTLPSPDIISWLLLLSLVAC